LTNQYHYREKDLNSFFIIFIFWVNDDHADEKNCICGCHKLKDWENNKQWAKWMLGIDPAFCSYCWVDFTGLFFQCK